MIVDPVPLIRPPGKPTLTKCFPLPPRIRVPPNEHLLPEHEVAPVTRRSLPLPSTREILGTHLLTLIAAPRRQQSGIGARISVNKKMNIKTSRYYPTDP